MLTVDRNKSSTLIKLKSNQWTMMISAVKGVIQGDQKYFVPIMIILTMHYDIYKIILKAILQNLLISAFSMYIFPNKFSIVDISNR